MAGNLMSNPRPQYLDGNGDPYALGTIEYFDADAHATPLDTYSDAALTVANANPVVLDAAGRPASGGSGIGVFLKQQSYYVVLKNEAGTEQWTADDVSNVLQVDFTGVLEATNVAGMTALLKANLTDNQQCSIAGYTTASDGGQGVFYWDSSSSATANGGTVIASDEGGTGRWLRVHTGGVEALWFGPNTTPGTTDMTAIVQAGLDADENVFIPDEVLLISGNLASGMANQTLWGAGWASILTHGTTSGHLIAATHDGFSIKDMRLNGDGTFNQSSAVANGDRRALVKATGDDFTSDNVLYNDGPQNALHLDSMTGAKILKNKFIGGPASMSDTAYQGIRFSDCSDLTIERNYFPGGANQYVQCIQGATFGGVSANNHAINNIVGGAWDHAVYMINSQGCTASGNLTVTDGSGIVMVGTSFVGGEVPGNTVENNICEASSSVGSGTVGIYARDANNSIFNTNHVFGFPTSMQMAPVQHDNAGNAMSNNEMCHNVCKGWTVAGIKHAKLALNLGDSSNNKFNDNTLIVGTATAASVAISAIIAQQSAADIAFDNEYSRNTIIGSGDTGISLGFQQRFTADGNKLTNPAIAGGTLKTAIYLPSCKEGSASHNRIKDTAGTVLLSGIDGNDTCTESDFFNNTIRGIATGNAPLRRLDEAADKNSFSGNRTGADPLTGTVTLDADASTTVANDNINSDFGMISFVRLTPINASAATLISGASGPYVRTDDHVDRTSFFINTANAGNAVGDEIYQYEIIQ